MENNESERYYHVSTMETVVMLVSPILALGVVLTLISVVI